MKKTPLDYPLPSGGHVTAAEQLLNRVNEVARICMIHNGQDVAVISARMRDTGHLHRVRVPTRIKLNYYVCVYLLAESIRKVGGDTRV